MCTVYICVCVCVYCLVGNLKLRRGNKVNKKNRLTYPLWAAVKDTTAAPLLEAGSCIVIVADRNSGFLLQSNTEYLFQLFIISF